MPFCPNCGSQVNAGDRFCANCGTAIQVVSAPAARVVTNVNSDARSDYRIVLVSRGTCSRTAAIDMLSDLLGYTDADAALIVDNTPMEAALGLTAIQAQYISQAITEYGMQVAIYNNDGYVDMGSRATSSVYNADGSFLSVVAGDADGADGGQPRVLLQPLDAARAGAVPHQLPPRRAAAGLSPQASRRAARAHPRGASRRAAHPQTRASARAQAHRKVRGGFKAHARASRARARAQARTRAQAHARAPRAHRPGGESPSRAEPQ